LDAIARIRPAVARRDKLDSIERPSDDETTVARPHFAGLPPTVKDAVGSISEFHRRTTRIDEEVNASCRLTGAHYSPVGVEGFEDAFIRCKNVRVWPGKIVDRRGHVRRVGHLGGQRAKMREDVADSSPT
jgi:hypothetical protein